MLRKTTNQYLMHRMLTQDGNEFLCFSASPNAFATFLTPYLSKFDKTILSMCCRFFRGFFGNIDHKKSTNEYNGGDGIKVPTFYIACSLGYFCLAQEIFSIDFKEPIRIDKNNMKLGNFLMSKTSTKEEKEAQAHIVSKYVWTDPIMIPLCAVYRSNIPILEKFIRICFEHSSYILSHAIIGNQIEVVKWWVLKYCEKGLNVGRSHFHLRSAYDKYSLDKNTQILEFLFYHNFEWLKGDLRPPVIVKELSLKERCPKCFIKK